MSVMATVTFLNTNLGNYRFVNRLVTNFQTLYIMLCSFVGEVQLDTDSKAYMS